MQNTMAISKACTNDADSKVKAVDSEKGLAATLAGQNADRHRVIVRNTFIDIEDNTESSPMIAKPRAQTSITDLMRLTDTDNEAWRADDDEVVLSVEHGFEQAMDIECVTTLWINDEGVLSSEFPAAQMSSNQDPEARSRFKARALTIRNTFIDTEDEDSTTPLRRQEKRAQTWHGRPCVYDKFIGFFVDEGNDLHPQVGDTSSVVDEDAATSYADCDSESLYAEVTGELSELELCPGLAKRVRVPPPLSRIHSPMHGTYLSSTESVSTTSSGAQASPFEASMSNSTSSGQCTASSDRESIQNRAQRPESLCTPHDKSAESSADESHYASAAILQHCHAQMPQQIMQPMLPSITGSNLQYGPLIRSSACAISTTCHLSKNPRQVATDVMPLYAFPCTQTVAFQPLQDAGAFGGLLQPQVLVVDPFVKVGTSNVAGVSNATSLQLGCPVLPSIGSAGHHKGSCKPCAFGGDHCRNGASCEFCHICKPIEKSKRGRWILKRRKQVQELQADVLNLQTVLCESCNRSTCIGMR